MRDNTHAQTWVCCSLQTCLCSPSGYSHPPCCGHEETCRLSHSDCRCFIWGIDQIILNGICWEWSRQGCQINSPFSRNCSQLAKTLVLLLVDIKGARSIRINVHFPRIGPLGDTKGRANLIGKVILPPLYIYIYIYLEQSAVRSTSVSLLCSKSMDHHLLGFHGTRSSQAPFLDYQQQKTWKIRHTPRPPLQRNKVDLQIQNHIAFDRNAAYSACSWAQGSNLSWSRADCMTPCARRRFGEWINPGSGSCIWILVASNV